MPSVPPELLDLDAKCRTGVVQDGVEFRAAACKYCRDRVVTAIASKFNCWSRTRSTLAQTATVPTSLHLLLTVHYLCWQRVP
jgi:hypothetical protein